MNTMNIETVSLIERTIIETPYTARVVNDPGVSVRATQANARAISDGSYEVCHTIETGSNGLAVVKPELTHDEELQGLSKLLRPSDATPGVDVESSFVSVNFVNGDIIVAAKLLGQPELAQVFSETSDPYEPLRKKLTEIAGFTYNRRWVKDAILGWALAPQRGLQVANFPMSIDRGTDLREAENREEVLNILARVYPCLGMEVTPDLRRTVKTILDGEFRSLLHDLRGLVRGGPELTPVAVDTTRYEVWFASAELDAAQLLADACTGEGMQVSTGQKIPLQTSFSATLDL